MSGNGLSKFVSPCINRIIIERNSVALQHLDKLGNVAPQLPPRAGDDVVSVGVNGSIVIRPLDNDNDVNGQTLSLDEVPSSTHAGNTLSVQGNTVTLNVSKDTSDSYDWFRYTIKDSSGLSSSAVVHIQLQETAASLEINPLDVVAVDQVLEGGSREMCEDQH